MSAIQILPAGNPNPAADLQAPRRVPDATYRLQFSEAFPFRAAAELAPYLADLGVSDVYASPIFRARAHSPHGYDVCDHRHLNPELGGAAGFEDLSTALRAHGLGLLLDIVPNHMGVNDPNNAWWMDVLENGPASPYAGFFDIDWHPIHPEMQDKVLLPVLGEQYGRVLEDGQFRLAFEDGAFFLYCYDTIKLPVNPRSYGTILSRPLAATAARPEADADKVLELQSIMTAIGHLPPSNERDPDKLAERNREKEVIKRRLAKLHAEGPVFRAALAASLEEFRGKRGEPHSFDLMDSLIGEQSYRTAFWRVAGEEINYRRFFDINDLAAIRVEIPEVFEATHQLAVRLIAEGKVTGLRIDHPDGLWDPERYFRSLQEAYLKARPRGEGDADGVGMTDWFTAAGEASTSGQPAWPLYVVAEKILADDEPLPTEWAVAGTTGYDFMNSVNGLFVDRRNREAFDRIYAQFTALGPDELSFREVVNETKKMVTRTAMASELNALGQELVRITRRARRYRDFTLNALTFALREVIACLPVYRTYVTGPGSVAPRDVNYADRAVAEAKRRNPRTDRSIFHFVRETLLLRNLDDFDESQRPALIHFAMKFQQVTGPVAAKGVEDSAFYRYYRLASLNEVGGSPDHFGVSLPRFHRRNEERQLRWPHSLLATSTHDNKRSEDVRARIDVLSELPDEWRVALQRYARQNAGQRTMVNGTPAPDRNDEFLYYQALLGSWPSELIDAEPADEPAQFGAFRDRITAYMLKAAKEAQVHTSWINQNQEYEAALETFILKTLTPDGPAPFLTLLRPLLRRVAFHGRFNSLSQTLLKLTCPGVPDLYQGTELWDLSLVDPDNRRPVDYALRRQLLAELRQRIPTDDADLTGLADELLSTAADGRIKLFLTHRALAFRRGNPRLFSQGDYRVVRSVGRKRRHVCAFARNFEDQSVVVVAPRLVVQLADGMEAPPVGRAWRNTWLRFPRALQGRTFRHVFTGERLTVREHEDIVGLPLAEVCGHFPTGLLELLPETQPADSRP